MAERALFLSSKRGDRATITASSQLSSLPVSNLQTPDPAEKWRTSGCATEYAIFDFGAAVIVNALMLVGHNLTGAATLQARLASTVPNLTAAPSVNTTVLSAWPTSGKPTDDDWPSYLSLLKWSNNNAYRYMRLDIVDAANPDGFVEIGRAYAGQYLQPAYNVDLNVGLGLDSPDRQVRSDFGKTFTDPRGDAPRRMVLPLSAINETDFLDGFFELQRYCGLGRDFGFVLDPAATTRFHKYAMQAVFAGAAQFEAQPLWDTTGQVWRSSLTLTEYLG